MGASACLGPEERLAFLFYDDAYYYLGVARHIAAGDGSTFDGLNRTNGYHPLWCAILVPLLAVFSSPGAGVRAAGILWFALAVAVPWAIWWGMRPRFGDRATALTAIVFSTAPWIGLSLARPNGLETPLVLLLVALTLGVAERALGKEILPTPRTSLLLGALSGLAILARLDAGFLTAAVVLAAARRSVSRAALVGLAALAVAGPYLLWNQVAFGHPLPVSGRVLSLEAERAREAHGGTLTTANALDRARIAVRDIPGRIAERALHGVPAKLVFGAGLLALIALGAWRVRGLGILATFAVLHGAAYALWLWTPGEDVYRAYYFFPQWLLISALAARGLDALLARYVRSPDVAELSVFFVLALLSMHLVSQAERQTRAVDAEPGPVSSRHIYGWIRDRLPEDAVLGARDAGKLGWFSGRPVVNLDGLINGPAFLEALRSGTVDAYICASPIDVLLYDRPYVATQLASEGACRVRDIGPATDDWVVLEVKRE